METRPRDPAPPASGHQALPAPGGQVALIPAEPVLPPHLRKPRLRRVEVVEYLLQRHGIVVAAATLAKWGSQGTGPKYATLHRTPYYPVADLDAWVAAELKPGGANG